MKNIFNYLLEHDIKLTKPHQLLWARENGNEKIIKLLFNHCVFLVIGYNNNGVIPLLVVCKNGNETIVNCLIEHGTNINKKKWIYIS